MVSYGGHSGKDIGEDRGNPIVILGKILSILNTQQDIYINEIDAGTWVTSIPRNATIKISCNGIDLKFINLLFNKLQYSLRNKYKNDNITISIETAENTLLGFDKESSKKVINYISNFPNGKIIDDKKYGYPVLSTNLGTVWIDNSKLLVENSIRSNMDSKTTQLFINRMQRSEENNDFTTVQTFDFPGYRQNNNSDFINYLIKKYKETFGKKPSLKEEHFLLECAWFGKKIPNLEYVSISPNIYNPHSPFEKVSISSMQNMWTYLKNIVKDLDKDLYKSSIDYDNEER